MLKILIVLCVMFQISQCDFQPKSLNISQKDNGKTFTLFKKDSLRISLESNPTTGFSWAISNNDTTLMQQLRKSDFESKSKNLGAQGKQIFHFQPKALGETIIKLIYRRPWETDKAPIDTFQVVIKITE